MVYTCRWVNGVPIRYGEKEEQALKVNWFEMSIWNEDKEETDVLQQLDNGQSDKGGEGESPCGLRACEVEDRK